MTDPVATAHGDHVTRVYPTRLGRLSPSLRTCLVILTIVTVLPLVSLFGLKGYQDYRAGRAAGELRTLEVARGMSQTVEAQLLAYIEGVHVLAQTSTLTDGNLDAFARRADAFLQLHPGTVLGLAEPNGQIKRVYEAGKPPHITQDLHTANDGVLRAVATHRPVVSNFYLGAFTHRPSFSVNVPVERDGQVIYVLSYNPTSRALQALIANQHLPKDWVISIFDALGNNVARAPNGDRFVGRRATDTLAAHLKTSAEGVIPNVTLEGIHTQTAYSHDSRFGWSVAIGVPDAELLSPLWQSLLQTAGLGVLALLLSGSAAFALARRVLGPVRILVGWATLPDPPALPSTLGLREADELAHALQASARERQAATEELRTLFDTSPVGIVRSDLAGRILEVNDAFLRLVGLSRGAVPVDGLLWDNLTPPEWKATHATAITDIGERGYSDADEKELMQADGTCVPVLMASAMLDRQTGLIASFAVDLSRAKQAEIALSASDALAREQLDELGFIYDTAPVGLCVLDRGLRYLRINERLAEINGSPAADHIGRTVREMVPDLGDEVEATARQIFETGKPALNLELTGETPACPGVVRTWMEHWLPQRDANGRVYRINMVVEEITDRKRIETSLAESEARLRLSQEAAGLGAWDWNPVTDELHWTPQQYRLLGLDPDTAGPPSFASWLKAIHPDDRAGIQAVGEAARAGVSPFQGEFRIIPHGETSVRWLLVRGETIRDANRRPVRILGVNMDVTERRRAEDDLRRLAETLEERVRIEVAARETAQMQLIQSQRMEALGKLAGGIAHDFNNVLQAVSGGLEFIQRRADDRTTVERFARLCSDAVKRGSAITNRLLSFARSGTLQAQPISPRLLLDGLKEMLAPLLGAGIAVKVDADSGMPMILADRDQLETALVNLSLNARDAMAEGGTLLLAAHVHPASRPDRRDGEIYIRLDVADTGSGMDSDTLARASEPFYTTKPLGKGTGLGLSMARGFAEQSGGCFAIDSAPDRGTMVSLWLPVVSPAPPAQDDASIAERSPSVTASGHLLLVDDDTMVAMTIAAQLEAKGYVVHHSPDAAAALAYLETETPDLLLTDFSMPGMDGLALIKEVRRSKPGLPAILLTGYAYANDELAAVRRQQSTTRLLRKPISGEDLVHEITALMEASRDARRQDTPGG